MQLTDADISNIAGGSWLAQYIYEKNGDMISRTIQANTETFAYDGHLMTDADGNSLSWDENGNLTAGVNVSLVWNWENKLREANTPDESIALRYDPSGNRIWKDSSISGTRKYIVDIIGDLPVILLEIDTSDDSIAKTYIYANSQIIAQHNGDYSDLMYFYLHDRLGSVRQLINTNGNVIRLYTYNPFGQTLEVEGTLSNPFRFTGQWFDREIDEYYLRERMYDPYISRFTSRDPVFGKFREPLTLHKYLYCGNDPINAIDPWGLFPYSWNNWSYYDFDYDETQLVIQEALGLVGTDFVLGSLRAFGPFGPGGKGHYDYKDTGNTFQISSLYRMKGSEFTNWLTGYTCFYHYGFAGELGARGGGHGYAFGEWVLSGFEGVSVDELASRYFLAGGIMMAQEARWAENREVNFMKLATVFNSKWDLNAGGIGRLASTDLTSIDFDRELDLFLTFWNSGAP